MRPVFVAGNRVVIRWIFEFEWLDCAATCREALACRRREGERIGEAQFFRDPARRAPRKP